MPAAPITYTVAYDGNGNTGGTAPVDGSSPYASGTTVTALGAGTLSKTGFIFNNWNTAANGSGIAYASAATFTIVANATLYAQWIAQFRVLDIDGNSNYDALTDGLLIFRYLSGLTGSSLTSGAIGPLPTRSTPADIVQFLDNIKPLLDVDGNGQADALTDGLLLIRYLFGLRGPSLIAGAIGTGATRTTAVDIATYIQSLMP